MGEVYEAYDTVLGRKVAVKMIRPSVGADDPELKRRFQCEAQAMARLTHPGTPAVHDAGVHGQDLFYLVMEYVEGVRLDDVIAEIKPLPMGWVAAVGAQVAAVLAAAHAKSVLHRDLKPGNLILCRDGAVKVIDFGLALLRDPNITRLTQTGQRLGTPLYMAPEQIFPTNVTPQSDLYSLGCVLYEMLAGTPPFTEKSECTVEEQHLAAKPVPVAEHRPDVPPDLADLIAELLAKDPAQRPPDAVAVYNGLVPHLAGAHPLPGIAEDPSGPLRMCSEVLTRILRSPSAPRSAARSVAPSRVGRASIGRVRREAMALARAGRHVQAAQVLAEVVEPDGHPLDVDDPEVVKLRLWRAGLLAEGGDRRAVAAFIRLGDELADRYGAADERVVQCRLGEADCYARLGDGGLALEVLYRLLTDQLAVRVSDDPLVLELRRRIGGLEALTGNSAVARQTLIELHEDLSCRHGADHPSVIRIREHLNRLGV